MGLLQYGNLCKLGYFALIWLCLWVWTLGFTAICGWLFSVSRVLLCFVLRVSYFTSCFWVFGFFVSVFVGYLLPEVVLLVLGF